MSAADFYAEAALLSEPRVRVLRAVLERMIPADEFAGACAAGVDEFVGRILHTDRAKDRAMIEQGLDALDAEARGSRGVSFADLPAAGQDDLLRAVETEDVRTPWPESSAAWFSTLLTLAMEGFYSDPGNGGNRGEVSWKMIGYDPGASRHGW